MTVVVMAGGLSNRFPPCKAVESITEFDLTLLDYSLFDAFLVGFQHIIFVANPDTVDLIREKIGKKLPKQIRVDYVLQTNDIALPEGISYPKHRKQPCGTGHALLCAEPYLKWDEPFLVMEASVFYGRCNILRMTQYLTEELQTPDRAYTFAVTGYCLSDCLSYSRMPVTASIFQEENGYLTEIKEYELCRTQEDRHTVEAVSQKEIRKIPSRTPCSMGMYLLTTAIFPYLTRGYERFLRDLDSNIVTGEYSISSALEDMLLDHSCKIKCFYTSDPSYSITYAKDVFLTKRAVRQELWEVEYPARLWRIPENLDYSTDWLVPIPLSDLPERKTKPIQEERPIV